MNGNDPQPIRPQASRLGWSIAALLYVLLIGMVLANRRIGVALDPAIANPAIPGPPAVHSTLLENLVSPGRLPLVLLIVWLAWLSIRQRRLHRFALIAVGSIATGLLDPLANWATVASLSPRQEHFPTDWPWFDLAPVAEPTSVLMGAYTAYYVITGVIFYWLVDRLLLRRAGKETWIGRHPLIALFIAVYILSFPLNMWLQVEWMKADVLLYTQFPGPILDFDGHKLPLLIQFYDPFVYAAVALLCVPDERGESQVLADVARRLPFGTLASSGRQAVAAALVLVAAFMVPIGSLSLLRLSGIDYPVFFERNPWPETKVYDPFGDLERSGKPGPFRDRL